MKKKYQIEGTRHNNYILYNDELEREIPLNIKLIALDVACKDFDVREPLKWDERINDIEVFNKKMQEITLKWYHIVEVLLFEETENISLKLMQIDPGLKMIFP